MHKESTNNIKFDQRIINRIEQSLISIKALYDGRLIEVSLFGSFAKGQQKKYSSIDLLVIIDQSEIRFVKRNAELQNILNENDEVPLIDPLVYSDEEIMELIHKKESFINSVLKESIVIWDKNGIKFNPATGEVPMIHSKYSPKITNLEEIEY